MPDPDQTEPAQEVNHLSFEDAFQRLGETVEALEAGGLTLAEATASYEEGMRLVQRCNQLLSETELKVTQLRDDYATPDDTLGWDDQEEE